MKKICLAVILALAFPVAVSQAEEDAVPPAAETLVPLDEASEFSEKAGEQSSPGPVLMAAAPKENVTTFQYNRQPAPERDKKTAEELEEPKKLQRSHSRPKPPGTYGYPGTPAAAPKSPRPAEDESRPIKKGLSSPRVTTFQYQRSEPAEAVETKQPAPTSAPAPKAATRRGRTAAEKPAPQPLPAQPVDLSAEEDRARPPAKPEVKYTTLNQRTEELDMAKPETVSSKGRPARVRTARVKTVPPLATPAFDGTSFNVAGIYVSCPKGREENCGEASEEFRAFFPKDQTAPYVMIRKDGRGYVAPDNKRTVDFTWQFLGDNALLIIMEDSKHRKVEYRTEGRYLRNMVTGDLFYLSLTDEEWNVEPEPYSKIKARREKAKK